MTDPSFSGEARDRANNRRRNLLFTGLTLAGGAVGFTFATFESKNDVILGGTIPPTVAIVLAVVTFISLAWGTIAYMRRSDEVLRQDNIYAAACGAVVVFVGYPVWFLLWKGGLLPEPAHLVIYGILYVVICAAYLYRKIR